MTAALEERPVGEVMSTDLLAVTADETTLMAWELMRRGGYHHIPVVTHDGHCVDVLDAETMADAWDTGGLDRIRRPVRDLVGRRPLPHVGVRDSVAAAARAMLEAQLDFVPVIDAEDRLVGLFTARDLIALTAGRKPHAQPEKVSAPTLYRIEPVLPHRHPGGSSMPPD